MTEWLQSYPWSVLLKLMAFLMLFAFVAFLVSGPRQPDKWNGPEGEGGEWP